ncbi:alpha-amylase family protein [Ruania zhangjianzhongii]|uniref:alpha-amylase family protein n=1 Tax=Ruania zhangjianzhongii TaxID=2603206 RepID=UPI0011CB071A|nr:beta-galactosidase trimerization domain-containing protein [Ruania zhangjianzhongii]
MAAQTGPWWRAPFRGFQTNLRQIDPSGLDVEKVLDTIEEYGADTWLLSVGGIIANYPSELDCQTVNPTLAQRASGDVIGDAVAAAGRRGIRVLARMDFSKIDRRRSERYPQWCFVGPDGEPQVYNGYRSVCPSSAYYQQKMFDVVGEVLGRYDIRGFFFNMMHFNEYDYSRRYRGVCQCESCRVAFAAHAPGVALPTGPSSSGYATWRSFATETLEDLNQRMSEHIRSLAPEAALLLKDNADVTYYEANNAVGRPLWHTATAESVSASRTADPERTVYVNCVGFVDMPYRWAGEDPHHFAQYLLQTIAHGGSPSTYVMGLPETGGYDCLTMGSWITRFHRDNTDMYAGLRSAARVGLVRGTGTGTDAAQRLAEFRGWYQSLQESHIPFDVVRQDLLSDELASRYDLLILPALGALAPDAVAAVEAILAAGGTVVAVGDSAWHKGDLQIGTAAPLATRTAQFTTQESLFSLHLPVGSGYAPAIGAFEVLQGREGAEADWYALGRSTYGPPELCYGNEPTPHPGWLAGAEGPGQLALVPWRPGQAFHELGLHRVREGLIDKVLELTGRADQLRIETDLPGQVQLVLGRNWSGATVLHLLNRSGDKPQRFVEPLPITPGAVRIPSDREPVRARARVAGVDLEWTFTGTHVQVQTPELGLFEVIELDMQS